MSPSPAPHRDRRNWTVVGFVLLLVAAAGFVAYRVWPQPPSPMPASAPARPVPITAAPPAPRPAPPVPGFDIVRVGPGGRAVIAGHAEPLAEIVVRDGDRVLGRTRADAQGQFVLLPDEALAPGARELTLSARGPTGVETAGTQSVLLIVPAPAPAAAPAPPSVAVLLPDAGAPHAGPRVLDAPAPQNRKLGLDVVDYDDTGAIRFTGSAKANVPIRLYVDNRPVGETRSDAAGSWVLVPTTPVSTGLHTLRVDQLGPDGKVVARIELPFQRTVAAPDLVAGGHAVVQPGQTLWRMARQSYGQGTRYTVIYLANRDRIRDPNRIYPGQIFAVPSKP